MDATSESVVNWVAERRLVVLQIYKLLQYVREKNKPRINKMVYVGVPNLLNLTEPKEGLSALCQASQDRDEDMVQFLLSLGAHPDIKDKKGRTPLMLAAQLGFFNIVSLLITNHANVNLTDEEGKGVLFYCISPGKEHALCLQMALTSNAYVNNISNSGKPLFVFACEHAKDCEDLCIHILEQGADPNAVNQMTRCSALMEAAKAGAVKLIRAILQKGGYPDMLDQEGRCAAHFAAKGGFLKVLQVLSAYSADLGVSSRKGNTPLHLAAAGGFNECCRFLAQRGCNPKLKNREGQLPSQIAKSNGHKAALKELKKAEKLHVKLSEPDAVNPNELWAITLHDWSCEHEKTLRKAFETREKLDKPVANVSVETFVSSLRAHQAPVSDENLRRIVMEHDKNHENVINVNDFFKGLKYLQKAFVIASCARKQAEKIKKSGKSSSSLPICVMPPEQISIRKDSRLPYYMIERYQPFTDTNRFNPDRPPVHPIENDSAWYINEPVETYTNIHYCVKTGDLESLSLAFTQQVPVDVKDQFFKTPLITASSCGNYKVAKFLISLRADVNATDQFNWTPLHHACHAGHVDIAILLVQSGAVVDAVTLNGSTPLMRAIESSHLSCVKYLIKAGANVMAKNKRDQNCFDIAEYHGDVRISDFLAKSSKKDKEEPTFKKEQEKMHIQSPSPRDTAAVKKDLRDNIIVKNPKFEITSGTTKSDIRFVPQTLWGKHLTNSPQRTEKEKTESSHN